MSAGGLRGAAHLGVLRQLVRHRIPINVIVGVSAGAIVAAFYAAAGFTVNEMIDDATDFRGRHILMHGLTLRAPASIKPYLRRFCGIIPHRLSQLDAGRFDTLHHGVQQFGIVCHDLIRNQPCYFSTAEDHGVRLADVVRASAAMPGILPSRLMKIEGEDYRLADGGISNSLPVGFAGSAGLGATHLVVSDCRQLVTSRPPSSETLVYIRPDLDGVKPLRARRLGLVQAVWRGEAAVTADIVGQMQRWVAPVPAAARLS